MQIAKAGWIHYIEEIYQADLRRGWPAGGPESMLNQEHRTEEHFDNIISLF